MKMMDIGIHGKLYNWIKYFLIDRTIQTKINDAISSKEVLEEGLPQGSSLSCTLFLIYINDLASQITAEKALYADDLAIWQSHEDVESGARKLNGDLRKLHDYCQTWKLKINCAKTVYTIFTISHKVAKQNITLNLDNHQLLREQHPTYLGVTLDRQLNLKKCCECKEQSIKKITAIEEACWHNMGIRQRYSERLISWLHPLF
uniref:Reverse transcriptase domain-containing protein n=1 Tax=Arion vulgaris TaxID=1028688 RepID=A0A0B7BTN5_9EUPU